MSDPDYFPAVGDHYARGDLGERILAALRGQGKDLTALTAEDIAPLTHLAGRPKVATIELGRLAGLQAGLEVLDLGSGLGGPARTLATEFGCRVTGLDLTEEFVRTAEMLTVRVGLGDRISFRRGNALEMPFPDATFDVVWHEQFAMHIADKERLYREVRRVLRPGGRLAMREFVAGPVQPICYPVPWAREAAISFLRPAEQVRDLLSAAGFTELAWEDLTAVDLARRRELAAAPPGPGAPLTGAQLLHGADWEGILQNMVRNYAEDRLRLIQAAFRRG